MHDYVEVLFSPSDSATISFNLSIESTLNNGKILSQYDFEIIFCQITCVPV